MTSLQLSALQHCVDLLDSLSLDHTTPSVLRAMKLTKEQLAQADEQAAQRTIRNHQAARTITEWLEALADEP